MEFNTQQLARQITNIGERKSSCTYDKKFIHEFVNEIEKQGVSVDMHTRDGLCYVSMSPKNVDENKETETSSRSTSDRITPNRSTPTRITSNISTSNISTPSRSTPNRIYSMARWKYNTM